MPMVIKLPINLEVRKQLHNTEIEMKTQTLVRPLTGIFVKRATKALDVKHTTDVTAKPATCMSRKILKDFIKKMIAQCLSS